MKEHKNMFLKNFYKKTLKCFYIYESPMYNAVSLSLDALSVVERISL